MSLDTVQQYATIYWGEPSPIDFGLVLGAANNAAFEVTTMILTSTGSTKAGACENCARAHGILELEGTGQGFSLAGANQPAEGPRPFVATVFGWESPEPKLSLRDESADLGTAPLVDPGN